MALVTPLTMKTDRKAMALVADLLDQSQNRRPAFQHDGFIFSSGDVNDLFAFSNAGQWLIYDIQSIQCRLCCMELADATVDQYQIRHVQSFRLNPSVSP